MSRFSSWLREMFPGEWVTDSPNGNFCVMGRETAIHTHGKYSARSERLFQAAETLFKGDTG